MAGSYNHVVHEKTGKLLSNARVAGMLENGGDVYEAIEEMYGMIWYLADQVAGDREGPDDNPTDIRKEIVESARQNYSVGLDNSPGLMEGKTVKETVREQMNWSTLFPNPRNL